eukprot:COSAG06_NODE_16880_length_975_cov_2.165525_2_plen_63_part_00
MLHKEKADVKAIQDHIEVANRLQLGLGDKGTTMMSAKRGLGKLNATAFPRKPSASFHSQFSQ